MREGTMPLAWLSSGFQSLPPIPTSQLGHYDADPWWACVCSRTLWVSPTHSLVSLGVSDAVATPTDFYSQRFLWLYVPMSEHWVAWSVLPPSFSSWFIHMQMWDCPVHQPLHRLPWSSSLYLAVHPLCPSCPYPPLLPV